MKETMSVTMHGSEYEGTFYPNNLVAVGEKVVVFHYFDNNGNEWNEARDYNGEELPKNSPSYSNAAGVTHYLVGLMIVTRVFTRKFWVR